MKILLINKKANYNYNIIEKYEAGIVLAGTEVKSISISNANIDEAFVISKNNEMFVINMYVAPFKQGNITNVPSTRNRKLLLNKNEIIKINNFIKKQKATIIPLKIYFKNKKIKIEIGIAKSKNKADKRDDIKLRDAQREIKKFI